MSSEQATQFWFKIAAAIGSLLVVAFITWAGVVWNGWQDVSSRIFRMSTDVAEMRVEVKHIVEEFTRHQDKPWHDEAGRLLIQLQTESKNNGR